MQYFPNDKAVRIPLYIGDGIYGPGFKNHNKFQLEIDSKNSYVARVSAAYDREQAYIRGTVDSHGFRCTTLSTLIQPKDIRAFVPRW